MKKIVEIKVGIQVGGIEMENMLRSIYQERASQSSTLGILLIEKRDNVATITNTFDEIILIFSNEKDLEFNVKHYKYDNKKAALYVVSTNKLEDWLMNGTNKKVYDWLFYGKVLFDRNDFLANLIRELRDFPFHERKLKIGIEFAKLINCYIEGKNLYEQEHYLDAYSKIIQSLHYLARVALIEKGFHPEIVVWNQVKKIEPEVFKMYKELVNSDEAIDKRLNLLFLASEFFIHSRTEIGSSHIMEVLAQKETWTIEEIIIHEELKLYGTDLLILLEYLVDKQFINIELVESKGKDIYHRYYSVTTE